MWLMHYIASLPPTFTINGVDQGIIACQHRVLGKMAVHTAAALSLLLTTLCCTALPPSHTVGVDKPLRSELHKVRLAMGDSA